MTTPVLLKLSDNTKFWQSGTYTMSFLLPSKHQKNPPKPTDDRVSFYHKTRLRGQHIKLC